MRKVGAAILFSMTLMSPLAAESQCCGDPNVSGSSTVTDVLLILSSVVGSEVCIESCCDVDNSGAVNVTDALAGLLGVVDDTQTLSCPDSKVVFSVDSAPANLAGMHVEMDLTGSGIQLPLGPDVSACQLVPSSGISAWLSVTDQLNFSYVIFPGSITAPADILSCDVDVIAQVSDPAIPVNVIENAGEGGVVIADDAAAYSATIQ